MLTGITISFIVENIRYNLFLLDMSVKEGARSVNKTDEIHFLVEFILWWLEAKNKVNMKMM